MQVSMYNQAHVNKYLHIFDAKAYGSQTNSHPFARVLDNVRSASADANTFSTANAAGLDEAANSFDMGSIEKYYDDSYYINNPYFYLEDNNELIRPFVQKFSNGQYGYFPPKDASDKVKSTFFQGLEKLSLEERKMVHQKIYSYFGKITAEVEHHLELPTGSQFTKENWDNLYGQNNMSYQGLFQKFVKWFTDYIHQSSDPVLIEKLKARRHAHQVMLDMFKQNGIN